MMSLSNRVIVSIDWAAEETMTGTGEQLAAALQSFVDCREAERMRELWRRLEGVAFAQTTIVGSAEPMVDVLMASLADERPAFVYPWIVEALRVILRAGSFEDPELADRCRERARRGVWNLAGTLGRLESADYRAALELIEMLDPRVHSWVRSDD